jgi:hypothetical protein
MDLDTRHDPFRYIYFLSLALIATNYISSDDSVEMPINLEEVDSLEAIVIIDNELDPLSPPAPDTVQVSGNLGAIAMGSKHTLTDRGDACKELRLEDVCCAAHGLSILVVRRCSTSRLLDTV